jgi:hypothetical protein
MVAEVSLRRVLLLGAGIVAIALTGVAVLIVTGFLVIVGGAAWELLYAFWDFVLPYLPQR